MFSLDARSSNGKAVSAAAGTPWPNGTAFCLLLVPATPPVVVPRMFGISEKAILERLDRAAEPLPKAGWSVRTDVRERSPGRTINLFAKQWAADLIVVGSHERSQLACRLLGTAQSVMRHAPCSVKIVRAERSASIVDFASDGWIGVFDCRAEVGRRTSLAQGKQASSR